MKIEERLYADFPYMYKGFHDDATKSCLAFGIECDEGWHDIIYELSKSIDKHLQSLDIEWEFSVSQVKEKFGGLRFYYDGHGDKTIYELVAEAEEKASNTCEECGCKPAEIRSRSWAKTLCDNCAAKG